MKKIKQIHGYCVKDYSDEFLGTSKIAGRSGMIDFYNVEKTGNVMFYPDGGNLYRICLEVSYARTDEGKEII